MVPSAGLALVQFVFNPLNLQNSGLSWQWQVILLQIKDFVRAYSADLSIPVSLLGAVAYPLFCSLTLAPVFFVVQWR